MTEIGKLHGRVAILSRHRPPGDPELIKARRDLIAANLTARVVEAIEADPPMTQAQRRKIAALLNDPFSLR